MTRAFSLARPVGKRPLGSVSSRVGNAWKGLGGGGVDVDLESLSKLFEYNVASPSLGDAASYENRNWGFAFSLAAPATVYAAEVTDIQGFTPSVRDVRIWRKSTSALLGTTTVEVGNNSTASLKVMSAPGLFPEPIALEAGVTYITAVWSLSTKIAYIINSSYVAVTPGVTLGSGASSTTSEGLPIDNMGSKFGLINLYFDPA